MIKRNWGFLSSIILIQDILIFNLSAFIRFNVFWWHLARTKGLIFSRTFFQHFYQILNTFLSWTQVVKYNLTLELMLILSQKLTEITAPFFLLNGFWVSGISDTMNIDGSDSKTSVKGMFVTVSDSTGAIIGCSAALA